MPNSLAWVQIGFAQVNPQADNRAPKLTLPNSHPAACHHRLALQSNKVYPPPCTTACSTWAVLAVDKRYSLARRSLVIGPGLNRLQSLHYGGVKVSDQPWRGVLKVAYYILA